MITMTLAGVHNAQTKTLENVLDHLLDGDTAAFMRKQAVPNFEHGLRGEVSVRDAEMMAFELELRGVSV